MDKRMVDFIRALRASGVRISLAESIDAMNGVDEIGVSDREQFRAAMKTTLVKENKDHDKFEYFFPLFFGSNQPPMQDIMGNMSPEQQQMLQQALEALMGSMDALRDLLRQLLEGKPFDQDQWIRPGSRRGWIRPRDMYQRPWFERRMQRQMNMQQLQQAIEQLLEMLQQMGMDGKSLQELREMLRTERRRACPSRFASTSARRWRSRWRIRSRSPSPICRTCPSPA